MIETGIAVRSDRATQGWTSPGRGCPVKFPKPRRSALTKIKSEAVRLANNGTREGFKFAEKLFKALPELKNA